MLRFWIYGWLEFYLRSYLVDLSLFLMQVLCTCASEMQRNLSNGDPIMETTWFLLEKENTNEIWELRYEVLRPKWWGYRHRCTGCPVGLLCNVGSFVIFSWSHGLIVSRSGGSIHRDRGILSWFVHDSDGGRGCVFHLSSGGCWELGGLTFHSLFLWLLRRILSSTPHVSGNLSDV